MKQLNQQAQLKQINKKRSFQFGLLRSIKVNDEILFNNDRISHSVSKQNQSTTLPSLTKNVPSTSISNSLPYSNFDEVLGNGLNRFKFNSVNLSQDMGKGSAITINQSIESINPYQQAKMVTSLSKLSLSKVKKVNAGKYNSNSKRQRLQTQFDPSKDE